MKDFIKKYKTNILIVLILSFCVYLFILFRLDFNFRELKEGLHNVKYHYFAVVLGLFFAYTFIEAFALYLFTRKKVVGFKFRDIFRLNLSTQFFNTVTPFSSGGQPYQLYYYSARGIKVKDSTSIVLMNFVTWQIAIDILGLLALIFKYDYFNQNVLSGRGYILLIGFGVNIFMTLVIFVLAFSKKIYHILVEVIWVRMTRWPILRRFNLNHSTEKFRETINDMNREIKELNNHKLLWIESVFLHGLRIVIIYSIPLFIFMALGVNTEGIKMNLLIGTFFVAMVMSYIPTPGASGGAEGLYMLIFSAFATQDIIVVVSLMLWRFVTYYLYMIIGFISLLTTKYQKDLHEINYGDEDLKMNNQLEIV